MAFVEDWIGGVGFLSLGLFSLRDSCEGVFESGASFHDLGIAHPLEALFPPRVAKNIVEHKPEIFVPWEGFFALLGEFLATAEKGGLGIVFPIEIGGEFPHAETGAMVAFAGLGAAAEFVAVFADVVLGRAGERGKPDFRSNEIFDIGQGEHVALGAIRRTAAGLDGFGFLRGSHPSLRLAKADDFGDFVPADADPFAALDDTDGVDPEEHLRFPEDSFQNAARCGRGDERIGDALDFHLGTSEAGEVSPDAECDKVIRFHTIMSWME